MIQLGAGDIPMDIGPEDLARLLPRNRFGQDWRDRARTAVDQALALITPAAAMTWVGVETVAGEQVRIRIRATGTQVAVTLSLGPHAGLMKDATEALVSVGSIGPRLDRMARQLQQGGDWLAYYLLDAAGVAALGRVGQAVRAFAEAEARRRGWGLTPSLGPGSLDGWPLEDQRRLCGLLDLGVIGVHLSDSSVLIPFKSASALIGIGPALTARRAGSVCRFCQHRATCWRRKE